MQGFALSERWNGWSRMDTMVEAARAAIAAGPLDPLVCEVTLEGDEDTVTLDSLAELDALLAAGADPLSLEILVAHGVEGEAGLRLVYNGRWLQINGSGTDRTRARKAYDAAQVELALVYGITTFKLPDRRATRSSRCGARAASETRTPAPGPARTTPGSSACRQGHR